LISCDPPRGIEQGRAMQRDRGGAVGTSRIRRKPDVGRVTTRLGQCSGMTPRASRIAIAV
jgi:hypothetical protein